MKAAVVSLVGHLCGGFGLMLVATLVGVGLTGPSVRAGERAVLVLGAVDALIAGVALARFAAVSDRFASGLARLGWSVALAVPLAVTTMVLWLATIVVLNR